MIKKFTVLLILTLLLVSCTNNIELYDDALICFEDYCFQVDIPLSDELKMQGLMHVENLELNKGMLFIFQEQGIYPFWMKNTLIPLDIIWLDENLSVVHIEKAMPCLKDPCKIYNPGVKSTYVLELNQNTSDLINLKVGDVMRIKYD